MRKIILLGYMGSGKTTVAKLLAKTTGFIYKDLDESIEKDTDLSVKDIFEQKGEIVFRKLEARILTELLSSKDNMVLSLGGGTPCYGNNMELLKKDEITTVYLKTSIEKLAERLLNQQQQRPLIKDQSADAIKEFIAKHLFERSYYYNQATVTVSTDDKSPEEIAAEIIAYSK